MSARIANDRFHAVVGPDPQPERLATGFLFTEGPIWHPYEKHLTFSDMPGDHMRRWSAAGGVRTFRQPSNKTNGNTYDRQGRMLSCEHATSRVTRTDLGGAIAVLATHFEGKELNSPNDIVVRSDGLIFFSDPVYGRVPWYGVERPQQLDFQAVYRMAGDGSGLSPIAREFAQPNGLCLSLDERRLFVNDSERGHIRVFEVAADGSCGGGEVWAELFGPGQGVADGMKLDAAGNLYCCGPGGLHVFAPDATFLGVIETPEVVANFTWGDDDFRSIFLTASTSLYRVRTNTPGRPLF